MQIITFNDIKNLDISMGTCYQWVCEMIENKNKTILPPKISLKPYEGVFCNVMPSIINRTNVCRGGSRLLQDILNVPLVLTVGLC